MTVFFSLADKEWKRKYFQEKKFSSTLENRIKKTKDDLQQLQGQIDRKQGNHLKGYTISHNVKTNVIKMTEIDTNH